MKADKARIVRMRRVRWLLGVGCVTEEYRLVKGLKPCKKGQLISQEDVIVVERRRSK